MAAFDQQRPPQQSLIDDCVHCGFCLDTCPTYALWGAEADSPRGRIVLMGEGLQPGSVLSDEMATHFDRCLGCMACVTACPSGVQYDRLIERVRPQVQRHHQRSRSERALRRLLYETLPYPKRLRALAPLLATARKLGVERLPDRVSVLAQVAPRTPVGQAIRAAIPLRTPAARAFSVRVSDISELLTSVEPRAPRGAVAVWVAYHDACHLAHAQRVREQPRRLLGAIPALELVEVGSEREICCGSAGIYNLVQPEAAAALGERKARHLIDTGAQAITAGNPGCAAQLDLHLRRLGHELPIYHPIELLSRSIAAASRR